MLGRAFRSNGQAYVEVRAAIPAVTKDHGPVHFTFTADAWSQLHKDRSENYPDLDIVGWFHTHPDLGVFYSSDDVVVHSAAFTLPWHMGMVVDPIRKEAGFFGWKEGVLERLPVFMKCMMCSHIPCWTGRWCARPCGIILMIIGTKNPGEQNSSTVYLPPSNNVNLPAVRSYAGFALGALGLLLSFFLLVGLGFAAHARGRRAAEYGDCAGGQGSG